jgi:hypothetical protein
MHYLLLLNNAEPTDGALDETLVASFMAAFAKYADALDEAGVLVSAEVLEPSAATTTLTLRDGTVQIQDGPFADTKEKLAGVFIVDVPDLDAALAWAEQCPGAHYGVIEIRPTAVLYKDGKWQPSD